MIIRANEEMFYFEDVQLCIRLSGRPLASVNAMIPANIVILKTEYFSFVLTVLTLSLWLLFRFSFFIQANKYYRC